MHPAIESKRADISRICRRHHVRRLEVFGSAARAADFDPATSDADFLVEFDSPEAHDLRAYFAVKAELEAILHRGIDLVEAGALRNPYLLADIDRAREIVYAA